MPVGGLQVRPKVDIDLSFQARRIAEAQRFLVNPSEDLLLNHYVPNVSISGLDYVLVSNEELYQKRREKLQLLAVVKMRQFCLRAVGHVASLLHLRICDLAENFVSNFDCLQNCCHLVRLDMSRNIVQVLPERDFWESLFGLRILLLHGNPLSNGWIALKGHHIVNGIVSLASLDGFAIADDEIIEGVHFPDKFHALTPSFAFGPSLYGAQPNPMLSSMEPILQIHQILKHHSPVTIIQRYWRGFQVRFKTRLNKMRSAFNTSPHVSSQALPSVHLQSTPSGMSSPERLSFMADDERSETQSPRCSPSVEHLPVLSRLSTVVPPTTPTRASTITDANAAMGVLAEENDGAGAQYEPAGNTLPVHEVVSFSPSLHNCNKVVLVSSDGTMRTEKVPRPHFLDVKRLEMTYQKLCREFSSVAELFYRSDSARSRSADYAEANLLAAVDNVERLSKTESWRSSLPPIDKQLAYELEIPRRPIPVSVQFLLSRHVMETQRRCTSGEDDERETMHHIYSLLEGLYIAPPKEMPPLHKSKYRVRGVSTALVPCDLGARAVIDKMEAGRLVRDEKQFIHDNIEHASYQERERLRKSRNGDEALTAARMVKARLAASNKASSSSLACLSAVTDAYSELERAEKKVAQRQKLASVRKGRDETVQSRNIQGQMRSAVGREERRVTKERNTFAKAVHDEAGQAETRARRTAQRNNSRLRSARREEYRRALQFSSQASSVSHALKTYDHQVKRDAALLSKVSHINEERDLRKQQRDLVSEFLTKRAHARQVASRAARKALTQHVDSERIAREDAAKDHVTQLKETEAQIKELIRDASVPRAEYCTDLRELERKWNTLILMGAGHVGKHPVQTS